jgi:hypothetical protein
MADSQTELIVEHWRNLDGSSHFMWSLWQGGRRLEMGRPTASADQAEQQGVAWCQKSLGRPPDRLTRL